MIGPVDRHDKGNTATDRRSHPSDDLFSPIEGLVGALLDGMHSDLFAGRGISVAETAAGARSYRDGSVAFGPLLIDDDQVVAVEAAHRIEIEVVDDFSRRLQRFRRCFPRFARCRVYGAVAGIEIAEGADRYAYRRGLFVIRQSGDSVAIANDERFRPKVW